MGHAGAGGDAFEGVTLSLAVAAADRQVRADADGRGSGAGAGGVRRAVADTFLEDTAEILCALNVGDADAHLASGRDRAAQFGSRCRFRLRPFF